MQIYPSTKPSIYLNTGGSLDIEFPKGKLD